MKSSNSQFLKSIKGSYFNTLNTNEDHNQGTYNKTKEKINMLEFELERNRDIIIRLRAELASKNKEISLLKVNKNKKSEEYTKIMRVIEEILKQCDQSTTAGFNVIENSLSNSDFYNNKKMNQLPQIGDMLHFSNQHKKIMKEMVFVSMLKNQISNLNEELVKKNEKIIELKKNQNSTNFSKLQNNFIKNFNELTQVKKENEFMKTRIEDVHHLLMVEKEDNFNLKNKLQNFQDKYHIYKDSTEKKTNALESMVAKLKNRERDCKIFHIRKGTSASAFRSIPREKKKSVNEQYEKEFDDESVNNKLNEEIKKMSKTMTQLRNSQNNKDIEIKTLIKEKQNLSDKISKLEKEKSQYLLKIETLTKKIEEANNKRKSMEKSIKDQAIDANKIIENLEKENKELKDINNNIKNEIQIKESLIEEEKSKTTAIKELLKEQEEENKKLNLKILELEKKIEELQNELINSVYDWIKNVKNVKGENFPMILVGNKKDKEKERLIAKEEGENIAKEYKIDFFEISNKQNINVQEAGLAITNKVIEKREKEGSEGSSPAYTTSSKLSKKLAQKNVKKSCC